MTQEPITPPTSPPARFNVIAWLKAHRAELRLVFELLDGLFFIVGPVLLVLGALPRPIDIAGYAAVASVLVGTVRLWLKKSALARRLGVETTSQDLPQVNG